MAQRRRQGLPKKQQPTKQDTQKQEVPKGKRKQKKRDSTDHGWGSGGQRLVLAVVIILALICLISLYLFTLSSKDVSGDKKQEHDSIQEVEESSGQDERRESKVDVVTEKRTQAQKKGDIEEDMISKDTPSDHETSDDTKKSSKKKSTKKELPKSKPKEEKPLRILQSPILPTEKDSDIAEDLSKADKLLEKRRTTEARKKFEELATRHPNSVRSHYGLAMTLDQMADEQQSNELLRHSIREYEKVWEVSDPSTPSDLLKAAMLRLGDRYGFMGQSAMGARALSRYLGRFPDDLPVMRELTIQYLMSSQNQKAKPVLQRLLHIKPDDGFALGHLGFVLKQELKYEEAIPLLYGGLRGDDDRSREGRFYFHLGDALQRLGRREEAYEVYQLGTDNGIFNSPWQRSLYNAPKLKAQSWWQPSETPYMSSIRILEKNWKTIRDEGMAIMNKDKNAFQYEDENLRETGDWKQFTLFFRGKENKDTCKRVPKTCAIVRKIPDAAGCTRGQIKYSVMLPGTHVWPHTGPTNCRLRMHLGLVIPDNVRIRVGNETG
jgi:aspartate beta-hydroxylase